MKSPIDLPTGWRKTLGIALVAVVAVVIVQGTGLGSAPTQFVSMATAKVKQFFAGLFTKKA